MAKEEGGNVGAKIKIGVCVMEKKVKCGSEVFSGPMKQILERLEAFGEFQMIFFGDKTILEDPVESWPICDCLIAFYSSGYPLEKAEAYAALRKNHIKRKIHKSNHRIRNKIIRFFRKKGFELKPLGFIFQIVNHIVNHKILTTLSDAMRH